MNMYYKGNIVSGPPGPQGAQGEPGPAAWEAYSTEETRIGTWVDGKPIYRLVAQFAMPSSDIGLAAFHVNIQRDTLIRCDIFALYNGDMYVLPNSLSEVRVGANDIYVYNGGTVVLSGTNVLCILEYTKTTDSASVAISADQPIANAAEIDAPVTICEYTKTADQATISLEPTQSKTLLPSIGMMQAAPTIAIASVDSDITSCLQSVDISLSNTLKA